MGVHIREGRYDQIVERSGFLGGNKLPELHSAVELAVLVNDEDRRDVVVFLSLTHKLVHSLGNAQVFADNDTVGRHLASYFIVVKGGDEHNRVLYVGLQGIYYQSAALLFNVMKNVCSRFGIELRHNRGRFFYICFAEISVRRLVLKVFKRLGEH